jgi:hypothetical protein
VARGVALELRFRIRRLSFKRRKFALVLRDRPR